MGMSAPAGKLALAMMLGAIALTATITPVASADQSNQTGIALSKLQGLAAARGALGIYLDRSGSAVVVMPALRAAGFSAADAAGIGLPIRVQTTAVTADSVKEMNSDLLALRASGPQAFSYAYYFDLPSARMIVQTDAPASAFAAVASKYPGQMDIQAGATGRAASDRQHDAPAFWGGAAITDGAEECSTGFVVRSSAKTYMVTAGHCFPVGATVWANNSWSKSGYVEGTVTTRNFPFIDSELISGGLYDPSIYNGAAGNDVASVFIYGRKSAWVGQSGYCATGQHGRICGWTVTAVNATACWDWFYCTGDEYAFSGTISEGGDSGGPIYYPYNGGALIAGGVSGFWCTVLGCTNYGGKLSRVLSDWGLTQVCHGICLAQV